MHGNKCVRIPRLERGGHTAGRIVNERRLSLLHLVTWGCIHGQKGRAFGRRRQHMFEVRVCSQGLVERVFAALIVKLAFVNKLKAPLVSIARESCLLPVKLDSVHGSLENV